MTEKWEGVLAIDEAETVHSLQWHEIDALQVRYGEIFEMKDPPLELPSMVLTERGYVWRYKDDWINSKPESDTHSDPAEKEG